MIKINIDYKHLNKSQIAHYYFCKELFNNPSPLVVPSIKEMDAEADKRAEEYRIELLQQELQDSTKTAEELADEAIKSVKDYYTKMDRGTWPKELT